MPAELANVVAIAAGALPAWRSRAMAAWSPGAQIRMDEQHARGAEQCRGDRRGDNHSLALKADGTVVIWATAAPSSPG